MTKINSAAIIILLTVFCAASPASRPVPSSAVCKQTAHGGAAYSAAGRVKNLPVIAAAARSVSAWIARTTPPRPTAIAAVRG